jgi:hypothetical protein
MRRRKLGEVSYNPFMSFQAFCPTCKKSVSVETVLSIAEWKAKIAAGESIEIMHTTASGDHSLVC